MTRKEIENHRCEHISYYQTTVCSLELAKDRIHLTPEHLLSTNPRHYLTYEEAAQPQAAQGQLLNTIRHFKWKKKET